MQSGINKAVVCRQIGGAAGRDFELALPSLPHRGLPLRRLLPPGRGTPLLINYLLVIPTD